MSNLFTLGRTFTEVALRKIESLQAKREATKTNLAEDYQVKVTGTPSLQLVLGTEILVPDERQQNRKIVLHEIPARVLTDGEWMSIELIDMSEKGFSFEVDRIMGGRFLPGQKLAFTLRIPELKEFSLYGRIQWKKPDETTHQVRCGVEIINVHGPGGGISVKELLRFLLEQQPRAYGLIQNPYKTAA